jgi:hypothetical protein
MPESTKPIEVHADVAKSFAKEYAEAVITDAMKILPCYQHQQDTFVVIKPRSGSLWSSTSLPVVEPSSRSILLNRWSKGRRKRSSKRGWLLRRHPST